jgi:hypothetical protein
MYIRLWGRFLCIDTISLPFRSYFIGKMSDACKKGAGPFYFISTVDLRDNLSEAVNRATFAHQLIVLTRRGRKIVGLVSFEDLLLIQRTRDAREGPVGGQGPRDGVAT